MTTCAASLFLSDQENEGHQRATEDYQNTLTLIIWIDGANCRLETETETTEHKPQLRSYYARERKLS